MNDLFHALVLGIVQGATEFIPVSSSGHLVIVPWLLGWEAGSLLFDAVLHWGTLLSLLIFFWRDFWDIGRAVLLSLVRRSLDDPNARLGWLIVLGTLPAAVVGLLFQELFEGLYSSPQAAALFLLVTALLLAGSEWLSRSDGARRKLESLNLADGIIIGLAQAAALAPGISRSGSTIAAGLLRNLRRDVAARFSFLLGSPAFFGAGLLQVSDMMAASPETLQSQAPALLVGLIASAVTGYVGIRFLLVYLRRHTLYLFASYCGVMGVVVLLLSLLSG